MSKRLSPGNDHKAPPRVTAEAKANLFTRAAAELLAVVPERTRDMLDARFGIADAKVQTLAEVGSREKISRERVRQIVEAGLAAVRRASPSGNVPHARAAILETARASGGVVTEELLLQAAHAPKEALGALRLVLSSMSEVAEARETQRTKAHWVLAAQPPPELPGLEEVLEAAERLLAVEGHVLPNDTFLQQLQRVVHKPLPSTVTQMYLSLSQHVVRTPLGAFGLRSWRDAVPRSVGDKACVVLREEGKPLHFRAVAEAINRVAFDEKRALPETVHNDLIRDDRFVLVGRGLYALKEWGYQPGRVADVIERVLRSAGHPLSKGEIIASVLKERLVKRNTILLSLGNHDRLRVLPDGTYALKEKSVESTFAEPKGGASGERPPSEVPVS